MRHSVLVTGQPFANRILAQVERDLTSVTMVTCDTSRMLTSFILIWLIRVRLIVVQRPVDCMTSRGQPQPEDIERFF